MSRRSGQTLLRKLHSRQLSEKQTAKIANILREGTGKNSGPVYVKGVHRGRFYRNKIDDTPSSKLVPSHLPQLPTPGGPIPHAFKSVNEKHLSRKHGAKSSSSRDGPHSFNYCWLFVQEWLKENWPTVVLNMGSVATLTGFTRSDVLELRMLSVTGSIANVIYNFTLSPTRFLPVCWSGLFAIVNAIKIREILLERHSDVHMSPEQEDIFIQHFMPHGITPRQFQILQETAEEVAIPKGAAIIRQGEVMSHVSLVVSGHTRASISGRRLTAASTIMGPKSLTEDKRGANWIGEMTFLETYWKKTERKRTTRKIINQSTEPTDNDTSNGKNALSKDDMATTEDGKGAAARKTNADELKETDSSSTVDDKLTQARNRYTIVAVDECKIWRWKFEQVEAMMNRSTDFRAALSRAMTSAIVSKVVNFTVNKTASLPTWTTWLDDWRYNAGAKVHIKTDVELAVEEAEERGGGEGADELLGGVDP